MKKTVIRQYAKLIATMGVNVRKGQPVVIMAAADQHEFVTVLTEECYRAGAGEVLVKFTWQPLTKLHVRWQKQKTLGAVPDWEEMRWRNWARTLPCLIWIESEDPDGLAGVNQEKYVKSIQSRQKVIKPIRNEMDDKHQWCIAAVPGEKWAKKVFPGLPRGQAIEKLWEAILKASRAEGDAVLNWEAHEKSLKEHCEKLNSMNLRKLRYKAGNGTDLTVGLIPEAQFIGGSDKTLGTDIVFQANIPTEEVFISPMRGEAEGIVYSSRPFAYRGQLVEDFSVRFENGRAVEVHAKKGEEALRSILTMDEGSAMLGECALVPYSSPIRESGLMFYNVLFDENAACHLALGRGFNNCLRGYENLSLEECREKGINDSIVHEDFMIGTHDLSITGVREDGSEVEIFRDGNWAF